jgi:hypothetical protein
MEAPGAPVAGLIRMLGVTIKSLDMAVVEAVRRTTME